jgi:cytochrome c-type biogenesis protein CcmH
MTLPWSRLGSGFGRDHLTALFPTARRNRRTPCALLSLLLTLALAGTLHAQAIEPMPFADHAQELRFQHLTAQLRCPMCQNETLADSNAPIARDLRNQIFQLMQHGQSDSQIRQYLVDRYSDYVLYDPPLKPGTWLLWFGPLLILLGGAAVVLAAIRQRRRLVADVCVDLDPTDEGDDW